MIVSVSIFIPTASSIQFTVENLIAYWSLQSVGAKPQKRCDTHTKTSCTPLTLFLLSALKIISLMVFSMSLLRVTVEIRDMATSAEKKSWVLRCMMAKDEEKELTCFSKQDGFLNCVPLCFRKSVKVAEKIVMDPWRYHYRQSSKDAKRITSILSVGALGKKSASRRNVFKLSTYCELNQGSILLCAPTDKHPMWTWRARRCTPYRGWPSNICNESDHHLPTQAARTL